MTSEQILEAIKTMTVLELNDLVKAIETEFGVTAAAPMAMMGGAGAAAPAEVEQTEFDVILTEVGPSKINVIKAVREVTGLGLKEAKDLVDNVPKPLKEKVTREEADAVKAKITEQGGGVEIK